jgi:hypothetical protein
LAAFAVDPQPTMASCPVASVRLLLAYSPVDAC